jgi:hypothetical protein
MYVFRAKLHNLRYRRVIDRDRLVDVVPATKRRLMQHARDAIDVDEGACSLVGVSVERYRRDERKHELAMSRWYAVLRLDDRSGRTSARDESDAARAVDGDREVLRRVTIHHDEPQTTLAVERVQSGVLEGRMTRREQWAK